MEEGKVCLELKIYLKIRKNNRIGTQKLLDTLEQIQKNKVVHLSNGVMSGRVKEALTDAAIAESFGKVIMDIF